MSSLSGLHHPSDATGPSNWDQPEGTWLDGHLLLDIGDWTRWNWIDPAEMFLCGVGNALILLSLSNEKKKRNICLSGEPMWAVHDGSQLTQACK